MEIIEKTSLKNLDFSLAGTSKKILDEMLLYLIKINLDFQGILSFKKTQIIVITVLAFCGGPTDS